MHLVTKEVEKSIRNQLTDKFALAIDGWTSNSTHYVGIFATFPNGKKDCGYESVLLAFTPLLDETTQSSDNHIKLMEYALSLYGRNFGNVVAIIGDNCNLNAAISKK